MRIMTHKHKLCLCVTRTALYNYKMRVPLPRDHRVRVVQLGIIVYVLLHRDHADGSVQLQDAGAAT